MLEERLINLQLFAEEEEETTFEGEGEGEEVPGEAGGQEESGQEYLTKTEASQAVETRLARERKKIAKMFGVSRLEDAAPYLQAGQAVTKASGLKPNEVVQRLSGQQQQQQQHYGRYGQQAHQPQPQQIPNATEQKLEKIETMLESEREEKVRSTQEAEARKEFGDLYDSYREDIEDKADDTGLDLIDAATIVLRPKLKEHLANQQQEKQRLKGKRKVEGSNEPPAGESGSDFGAKLNSNQKRVAQRMNMSYKDYYTQLKELGRIE